MSPIAQVTSPTAATALKRVGPVAPVMPVMPVMLGAAVETTRAVGRRTFKRSNQSLEARRASRQDVVGSLMSTPHHWAPWAIGLYFDQGRHMTQVRR
jgi:hypothetical protein